MSAVESPAALLRRAAEKIRKLAEALGDNRGPWYVSANRGYPQEISNIGVPYVVAQTYDEPIKPLRTGPYIAAMHPGVGVALADVLEQTADVLESTGAPGGEPVLRLARVILGGES